MYAQDSIMTVFYPVSADGRSDKSSINLHKVRISSASKRVESMP